MSRNKLPNGSVTEDPGSHLTLHIVWILTSEGPIRFGTLRQKIEGISAKVLTERLRLLEAEGFVHREYEASIPPKVTYAPTGRMRDLSPVLCRLNQLAAGWYGPDLEAKIQTISE